MHMHAQLLPLVAVLSVALAAGMVFTRLRQPALVGYLLTGIVLGPSGFALVQTREYVSFLADLGVLLLLFIVGMELSLRGFRAIWKIAVAAAFLQIGGAVLIMWIASHIFGWSTGTAILLGFVTAVSSTAVVIKMLEDMNLLRTQVGQLTVGVLIAQDLAIIPMILVIGILSGGGDVDVAGGFAKIVLSIVLLVLLVLFLSRREKVSLPFSRALARSSELRPLYGTALCFGAATASGFLGLSPVYGAFLAGLVVGNSSARRIIFRGVQPLQNILVMVFFVSIGLLIDLSFVADHLGQVLLILFFVTIGKTVLNIGILMLLREPWPHAFISGLMLAQIGEFSFLLGTIGLQSGLINADEFQLVITVTAFTLIVSPLWLTAARRMLRIAVAGAAGLGDVAVRLKRGGVKAILRAASDRPLPSGLAFRVFGKPRAPAAPKDVKED
ncbi:MAG: cation:proton antiporter [Rhodospirillales bacterium]|nr:cation:proton antiporter [Rhodospirillales bacterium]MCW9002985.1 cation:proton antiporter [Rhodospirillales bacterium]MCW9040450.1 cation:proton antiporter [Rhodospirillales bacterium]